MMHLKPDDTIMFTPTLKKDHLINRKKKKKKKKKTEQTEEKKNTFISHQKIRTNEKRLSIATNTKSKIKFLKKMKEKIDKQWIKQQKQGKQY